MFRKKVHQREALQGPPMNPGIDWHVAFTTTIRSHAVDFQAQYDLQHMNNPGYMFWVDWIDGKWIVYVGSIS